MRPALRWSAHDGAVLRVDPFSGNPRALLADRRGGGLGRLAYTYAISPLAVLIAAAVLGEELSFWLVLGAVLVVGGIALAQRTPRQGALG